MGALVSILAAWLSFRTRRTKHHVRRHHGGSQASGDLADNHVDACSWVNIKQEMVMIGQHRHFYDGVAIFGLLGEYEFLHPSGYYIGEHLPPILRAKDNMVLATVHNAVVSMVGFARLTQFHISPLIDNCAQYIIAHLFYQRLKGLKRVKGLYPGAFWTSKASGVYALLF
jgi:hypothetical protein